MNENLKENSEIRKTITMSNTDVNQELLQAIQIQRWNLDKVQHWLEKGADVNFTYSYGKTPLHLSANQGKTKLAKLLIEKGRILMLPMSMIKLLFIWRFIMVE